MFLEKYSKDVDEIIKEQKKLQNATGEDLNSVKEDLKDGKGLPSAEGKFEGKGKTEAEKEATEVPGKEENENKNGENGISDNNDEDSKSGKDSKNSKENGNGKTGESEDEKSDGMVIVCYHGRKFSVLVSFSIFYEPGVVYQLCVRVLFSYHDLLFQVKLLEKLELHLVHC